MLITHDAGEEIDLDDCGSYLLTDTAHGQLAEHVGIPKAYYDRLRSNSKRLLEANVNHWLCDDTRRRMVRTLDGEARAILSDRYRPLDNYDLAQAVLPALASGAFKIVSSEITEKRLYLKAVTDRITAEVKTGDVVQAGITISNSEVGLGSLSVDPFALFLVCQNGMTMPDAASLRKVHVGRGAGDLDIAAEWLRDETRQADDRAFWLKVRDAIAGTLTESFFQRQVEKLRGATLDHIEADPAAIVDVTAKRYRLTDNEKFSVLRHFLAAAGAGRRV